MRALVIGAAVSGRAALRLLEADGYEVLVYDADPAAVADLGAGRQVHGGSWDPALLAGADLVVSSLRVGLHHLTLAAVDSQGHSAQHTIAFTVLEPPHLYLPVLQR